MPEGETRNAVSAWRPDAPAIRRRAIRPCSGSEHHRSGREPDVQQPATTHHDSLTSQGSRHAGTVAGYFAEDGTETREAWGASCKCGWRSELAGDEDSARRALHDHVQALPPGTLVRVSTALVPVSD